MPLIVLGGLSVILTLVSLVILVIVLVKQFKHGGLLRGFLGIVSFGLYTFVWGWMKHKPLNLTRIMLIWSLLSVVSIVVQAVAFTTGAAQMLSLMNHLQQEITLAGDSRPQPPAQKSFSIRRIRQNASRKAPVSSAGGAAAPEKNWDQLALTLWQGERYSDPQLALEYWNRVLQDQPETPEAYNNRGLAFYEMKRYQKAIQDYSRAIELNAEQEKAYNNRGNAYYALKNYQLALNDFNRSLQLRPNYSKARLNRGLAYYQLDKGELACVDFAAACGMGECTGKEWAEQTALCR
jgi:tetratricopeptide (TPR) repeat protein